MRKQCLTSVAVVGSLVVSLTLAGCATTRPPAPKGNKYSYSYVLTEPKRDSTLSFRDAHLGFWFVIDDAAILLEITNVSKLPVVVDWPSASIRVGQRISRVRTSSSYQLDNSPESATLTVKPGETIHDFAMPYGALVSRGKSLAEVPLFPTMDLGSAERRKQIQANVGQSIMLTLPVQVGKSRTVYSFVFRIVGVEKISWANYKRPERLSRRLAIKGGPSTEDILTGAAISAGFIGAATYFLTAKKNPRSD
jgi:hypothetical protein